ncbi:hypothetical protein DSO57_1017873 [Entomophthora muscae]|uniref:Uncharacterized protein n=1 Tax=Entomophthora muscae TaxID=34485 RepID=A0ACC2TF71_9FUNG|nr:hypothetical protein DSO57_1017873 [Entomophthora muscae]
MKLIIATLLSLVAGQVPAAIANVVSESVTVRPFTAGGQATKEQEPITNCLKDNCFLSKKKDGTMLYVELSFEDELNIFSTQKDGLEPYDGVHIVASATTEFSKLYEYISEEKNNDINKKSLLTLPWTSKSAAGFEAALSLAVTKFKAVFINIEFTALIPTVLEDDSIKDFEDKIIFLVKGNKKSGDKPTGFEKYAVIYEVAEDHSSSSLFAFKHDICTNQG